MRTARTLGVASLVVVMGIACANRSDDAVATPTRQFAPAGAVVDALVRLVIQDRLSARDIPDLGLLQGATRIAILSDLPVSRLTLGPTALPALEGYEFRLVSTAEAAAEADRTGTAVRFLAADSVAVTPTEATLWIGVDFVTPSKPGTIKTCCCRGMVRYRKAQDRWQFVEWGDRICG